jgi:hypothetical protein
MTRVELVPVRSIVLVCGALLIVSGICFSQNTGQSPRDRVPVLIELFTSEGCSTCPPADRFVETLDSQPIPGLEAIVLSEHVDYWDHLGWRDRFSSVDFSDRQRSYGAEFHLPDVYTPQLVIDGYRQLSGVDTKEAEAGLREAGTEQKIPLRIASALIDHNQRVQIHFEGGPVGTGQVRNSLDVYVALALSHAETDVARGENANRHLTHTAVARSINHAGKIKGGMTFSRNIEIKIEKGADLGNLRVVVFLQDPGSLRVFGAAMKLVDQVPAVATKAPSRQPLSTSSR